jgi:hypothetical protein
MDKPMPKKSKKQKPALKKTSTPPPIDIGLPKSGLVKRKRVMDIVPHSKTMPSSSAKPILVSHRAVVKDPMAPPELTDVPTEKVQAPRKESKKVVIQPLHDDLTPAASAVDDADTQDDQPFLTPAENKSEDSTIEDAADTAKTPKPEKENPSPKVDDAPDIADTADDIKKSTEPKPEDVEREKAEKRADEAAELIASKKYFLPINSVKKRRSMRLLLLVLLCFVVVVGAGLYLLDIGIITAIKAPTDFIPN